MRFIKKYPILEIIHHTLFIYPTPINLTYLWNFGVLALFFLVIQIISGIFLAMHYCSDSLLAFSSVEHIMRDINYGWLLRYVHSNGASMFFFVVYIHLFRGLYYSSFVIPRELLWCSGVVILLLMILTAFMGYVLPWGQMSFWAATVITNLATAVPFGIGDYIVIWLWGGFSVGGATLSRFFSLHYLFPFILLGLALGHLILLHENGSNNLTGIGFKSDDISFGTYYIWKDFVGIIVFLFIYLFFIFFYPNILGHSDNYILANPLVTPTHIVPEWYFLPFYAILRSVPDKLFGVLLLLFSIFVLLLLPFIFKTNRRSFFFQPFLKIFYWFFVLDCCFLGWLGGKPIEYPFLQLGQLSTFFYFIYFILLLPFLLLFEKKIYNYSFYFINYLNEYKIGALTSKSYFFNYRSWEMKSIETVDIFDSLNSNICVYLKGNDILRILPKLNEYINKEWISDATRFSYDSLHVQRLINVWLKNGKNFIEINFNKILYLLKKKIFALSSSLNFLFNLGTNIDLYTFIYMKKFMSSLGSFNFALFLKNISFFNISRDMFFFNSNFIEFSNLFLIDINPRRDLPILNLKFLEFSNDYLKKIFFLGNYSSNLNYNFIFLHNNFLNIYKLFFGKLFYSWNCFKKHSLFFFNSNFNNLFKLKKLFIQLFNKYWNLKIFVIDNSIIHYLELIFFNNNYLNNDLNNYYIVYNLNTLMNINIFKNSFNIYQGTHTLQKNYDLIIPSSSHFEKNLYYLNIFGLLQKTSVIFFDSFFLNSNWAVFIFFYEYFNLIINLSHSFLIYFYSFLNNFILYFSNLDFKNLFIKKIFINKFLFKIFICSIYSLNSWIKSSNILGSGSQFFLKKKTNFFYV